MLLGMLSKRKQIRSVLMGGIGNQLFQYSFGCMIAEKYGRSISLDLRGLPSKGQQKNSSILDLKVRYQSKIGGNPLLNYAWKIFILRALRSTPSPFSDFLLRVSKDPETSVAKNLNFSVAEYFADRRAIEYFKGEIPLSLSYEPSKRVQAEFKEVSRESTVAIHHRLGDSVKLRGSRGLLGPNYFKKALHQVSESTDSISKIRVYSDDPDLSKELLKDWLDEYELSWAPESFSAAEVLTSMARARHLVLSNSTMSWWAAAGGLHDTVVAPTAWDVSGSNHLNLGHWKLCDPDWT